MGISLNLSINLEYISSTPCPIENVKSLFSVLHKDLNVENCLLSASLACLDYSCGEYSRKERDTQDLVRPIREAAKEGKAERPFEECIDKLCLVTAWSQWQCTKEVSSA